MTEQYLHNNFYSIEDGLKEWGADCRINPGDLGNESLRVPNLHSKYYGLFVEAQRGASKQKKLYARAAQLKKAYYLGHLSNEQCKKLNWTPFPLKVMRNDVQEYLEADEDLQKIHTQVEEAERLVKFFEDVLKELKSRNYAIKNAIDWSKMINGA